MHTKQPNRNSFLPVLAEQSPYLLEDFGVELGWHCKSMSARQGCEVLVAQLQLHGARMKMRFAQPASDHLRKAHERGFKLAYIGGIFVVSVFVADRLGCDIGTDF